ncbi:MAG: folate-binding protein YgfZ [Acetobacteraceae bacterium]|nr:folate-binding protein YgfZ [Acetobacteraceae bacterium]
MTSVVHLPARGVIGVGGEDRVTFLQGLVSNDVTLAAPGQCVWAALLTPQGKWLADFFIFRTPEELLLDCEAGQIDMLLQRLSRFRLRSRVTITPRNDLAVFAAWGGPVPADGITAPDPRHPEAGHRILSPVPLPETATFADWDRHRLVLGLPDGSRDLEPEKTVLLEAGFDELNGVSWSKGCYMGQELTARTKYRGLVKRRLIPVRIHGPAPASGSVILRDSTEVGTMRSSSGDLGLALLRLDSLRGPLVNAEAHIEPRVPAWMRLPEAAA